MYLNKDFKLIKRDKYIIWSIIGFFWLCAVVLFVVTTSHFKYDNAISEEFFKGMDYHFFRGWTMYFVNDANVLIISIIIPVIFILIESLYAFKKKYNPSSWGSIHYSDRKWFYYVFYVIFPIFAVLYQGNIFFADYGFGRGYDYMEITGMRYAVPAYIVSVLVNLTIFYSLMYYVRNDIAKRRDFLESRLWQRSFTTILFIIFVYFVVLLFKNGFERPYWYNLHWGDYLQKIKEDDLDAYNNYMSQDKFNWGWSEGGKLDQNYPVDLQSWPWYRVAHGFFKPHGDLYKYSPWSDAFPSGHMGMSSIVLCSLWYVLFSDSKTKEHRTLKYIMWAIGLLYIFNLFFSLLISLGHWASDLAFTLMYTPIAFWLSKWSVDAIVKSVRKHSLKIKRAIN